MMPMPIIGMNATILENTEIGEESLIAAGSIARMASRNSPARTSNVELLQFPQYPRRRVLRELWHVLQEFLNTNDG